MHLPPFIRDLAVILSVAGGVSFLFQRIRQPIVLGYIVAGVLVGPWTIRVSQPWVSDFSSVRVWAELGVIFLMFSLGLEFSLRKISKVGLSAGLTACIEIPFMALAGYLAGRALGWRPTDSVYLGAMVCISSTTIIAKSLEELGLRTRRFAQMIFGVLIVEDLLAVLILVVLSMMTASQGLSGLSLLKAGAQLVLVVGSWFLVGSVVVPRLIRWVGRSRSEETLTIAAVSLCLGLVVFAGQLGYSAALGAFMMGSLLAESTESYRVAERLEPLKDFFSAIFFVSIGMLIDPRMLLVHWKEICAVSAVVVFGKTIAVSLGALISGQTLRTAVQVGFGMAQIGEFSFIIAALGLSLRQTSESLYSIAVAVSVITTFMTPYLIRYSHRMAVRFEALLPQNARILLARYAAFAQSRRATPQQRQGFYILVLRWLANAILTSAIFLFSSEKLLPTLQKSWPANWLALKTGAWSWPHALAWFLAVLASAPFLWAMFAVFREPQWLEPRLRRAVLAIARILAIVWVGMLSLRFFSTKAVLFGLAFGALILLVVFYRRLEASYHWLEQQFLMTFQNHQRSARRADLLRQLAPWDAHLVRIKVHPNSDWVLKSIAESGLRERFGLNVIAIQRGLQTLVAPRAHERLLPKDELLILGTDEQIEHVRGVLEHPPGLKERFRPLEGYELRKFYLTADSPLAHQSIRESGIRELHDALMVGLERDGRRIINPDASQFLFPGDVVWIVGEKEKLDQLEERMRVTSPSST